MEYRRVDGESLRHFEQFLRNEEKSEATVEKYMHDVRCFVRFIGKEAPNKQKVMDYKKELGNSYAITSANSMLAALNAFLRFCGWQELCVKRFKVQKAVYRPDEKELTKAEYIRLVETARKKNNERLDLILQSICGTGIRVSELQFITVEAVERGEAFVCCKGKNRRICIVSQLRKKLLRYIKERRIRSGAVFVTRNGKPVSRHNIWREVKALCEQAKVSPQKDFPQNLRHLFARTFYGIEKDIAKLSDILGHTSIDTTRIYIATTGLEHKRKMENMRLIL